MIKQLQVVVGASGSTDVSTMATMEDRQQAGGKLSASGLRSLDVQPFASMRIHHVQLTRSSSPSAPKLAKGARNVSTFKGQQLLATRLHLLWKLNSWFILAVSLLFCIARASAATGSSSSDGSQASATRSSADGGALSASSDWYIVLVSIPVLDKVLPLKHLAEELLDRGYRVGFALPEVGIAWLATRSPVVVFIIGWFS